MLGCTTAVKVTESHSDTKSFKYEICDQREPTDGFYLQTYKKKEKDVLFRKHYIGKAIKKQMHLHRIKV